MNTETKNLLRTPFHGLHTDHGAKFVDFAGWEMPIHYGSILDEHRRVRSTGGLFDVSHMGRIRFSGAGADALLERVLTRRVGDMQHGQCRYSLVCNEQGGVLDDVLIYRFPTHWLLVVNASNRHKIVAHVHEHSRFFTDVTIEDQTASTAMIAIQGPKVIETISRFSNEVPSLKRYRFCVKTLLVLKIIISRTGYTGEDGVEVILPATGAAMIVKMMLREVGDDPEVKQVLQPVGLGARDTLRIEAGMPLYGHELDETTDPLSAGLAFAVNLDKGQSGADPGQVDEKSAASDKISGAGEGFVGQDALMRITQRGPKRKLMGLQLDGRRTARQGMKIYLEDHEIGMVTSGCLSPTLGCPIAMAYLDAHGSDVGDRAAIQLGANRVEAQIVSLPFLKRPKPR